MILAGIFREYKKAIPPTSLMVVFMAQFTIQS